MVDGLLGVAYDPSEWEHGLRCAQCSHLFERGDRYSERLEGVVPGIGEPDEEDWTTQPTAMVLIVCVACALAGEAGVHE